MKIDTVVINLTTTTTKGNNNNYNNNNTYCGSIAAVFVVAIVDIIDISATFGPDIDGPCFN